jgi:hypothetical protein
VTKIDRIFFCDSIAQGQFGKINIFGFIPTNSIALNELPYTLVSHLVVWGLTSEADVTLRLKLEIKNDADKTLSTCELDARGYKAKSVSGQPPFHLFMVVPCKLTIEAYGSISISILSPDNSNIYQTSYKLMEGEAPHSGVKDHIPQSATFSGADTLDSQFVVELIGTANKSLTIFDAYVDPAALRTLLAKVQPRTVILLITGPQGKAAFQADKSILQQYPSLRVKVSPKLHDRFIVINNCEYFHFGHSLKDVVGGKLSRCSKIINKDELAKLVPLLDGLERQAVKC